MAYFEIALTSAALVGILVGWWLSRPKKRKAPELRAVARAERIRDNRLAALTRRYYSEALLTSKPSLSCGCAASVTIARPDMIVEFNGRAMTLDEVDRETKTYAYAEPSPLPEPESFAGSGGDFGGGGSSGGWDDSSSPSDSGPTDCGSSDYGSSGCDGSDSSGSCCGGD